MNETVDVDKLKSAHSKAKQTSDTLRAELKKADFIEKFLAELIEVYSSDEEVCVNTKSSSDSKLSPLPSPRLSKDEYSIKDALSQYINSSVETLVNIGLGQDAIDVTENHEIQVNSLVGKSGISIESANRSTGVNRVKEECQLNHIPQDSSADKSNRNLSNKDEVDAGLIPPKVKVAQRWSLESHVKEESKQKLGEGRKFSMPEKADSQRPAITPRSFSRNIVRPKNRQSHPKSGVQVAEKFFSHVDNESGHESHGGIISDGSTSNTSQLNGSQDSLNTIAGGKDSFSQLPTGSKQSSYGVDSTCKHGENIAGVKELQDTMKKFRITSTTEENLVSADHSQVLATSFRKIKNDDVQNENRTEVSVPVDSEMREGSGINRFSNSFHGLPKKSPLPTPGISQSTKESVKCKTSSLPTTVKRTRVSDYENLPVDFLLRCKNTSNFESSSSDEEHEEEESDYVTLDEIRSAKQKQGKKSVDSGVGSVSVESLNSNDTSPSQKGHQRMDSEGFYDNVLHTHHNNQGRNEEYRSGKKSPVLVGFLKQEGCDGSGNVSPDTRSEDDSADEEEIRRMMSVNTSQRLRQQKLHMRKMLVKGILESERTYLATLHDITELKRKLQEEVTDLRQSSKICSMEDVTSIFQHIEEIHKQHTNFVNGLQDKVTNWSDNQQIGETFKELVVYFPLYMKYVNHNQEAQERLQKCCQESDKFRDIVGSMYVIIDILSIPEILFTPVQRLQRNTLVLHDLLKHTPDDHPDHKTLTKALDLADHNLRNFASDHKSHLSSSEDLAHLVKSGFVVEMEGRSRKLRFLFLFSDVLVCTKHKQSGRHKVNSFEVKWYIPVKQVEMEDKNEQPVNVKEDLDSMKKKIVSLKSELRSEVKSHAENTKDKSWSISGKVAARSIDKLKKKIEEQEAALILASPRLPLHLKFREDSRDHTILLSTDFEREEWRDAIQNQQTLHHGNIQRQLSGHDIQGMINDSKQLPQVNNIGNVLLRKDEEIMNGALNVTIHKLNGLEELCDTYVELHLDSYGHFFMKARTSQAYNSTDPTWDEDFELELEGSQSLRILCYKKSGDNCTLIGRSALELSTQWLSSKFQEQKISMNELSLTISVRHSPATKTLKRTPSRLQGGIFGAKISTVTSREKKTVPTIVTSCIKEVEGRGMTELGIYRVSGVTSEVQKMKKAFDKNIRAGVTMLADADIHAVTGLLKLYFRELPEPLFTEARYKQLLDSVGLHDGDAKEKVFLELVHDLPDENYYTVVSVIEHLVKVSRQESENKMSLNNLATIFGPTLLHPAVKEGQLTQAELMRGAQDVFLQAEVLQCLLAVAAKGKNIRRSERVSLNPNRRDVLV
ncbi:hypothetical protein FSP39_004234 [Pinctada imbricata]|uniref:Active breakpoint cluster region-related protein n=1 Tax=Pinctada imbricata TaxID=66713 RepID=A0AA89BQK8_PINIB|nr:hypothetical protein FSP39_004234 [Pinctada imbricata]